MKMKCQQKLRAGFLPQGLAMLNPLLKPRKGQRKVVIA